MKVVINRFRTSILETLSAFSSGGSTSRESSDLPQRTSASARSLWVGGIYPNR